MTAVLLVHLAATWAMVGLIWFVQLVHYPLFATVGRSAFQAYEARHTRRTSWLVGVIMPVEAATAVWLLVAPSSAPRALIVAGLILLAIVWLSTAIWQAPLHGRLGPGYDGALIRQLVRSNWLRTGLWSVRGAIVLAMVAAVIDR